MGDAWQVYGYSYLGAQFREVLRLNKQAVVYKSRAPIPWTDVVGYRAYPDFLFDAVYTAVGGAKPMLCLYVRDGRRICLRGDVLVTNTGHMPGQDGHSRSAFVNLRRQLVEFGVPKWKGPRDELIFAFTAAALFVIGAAALVGLSVLRRWPLPLVGAAVIGGVLLSQSVFVIAPWIGRLVRRSLVRGMERWCG